MMKTSLIPALVSLMITLGMMDTAYATSQTGLHAPLSVREAPDLLNKLTVGAYELTVTSNQDCQSACRSPKNSEELQHHSH